MKLSIIIYLLVLSFLLIITIILEDGENKTLNSNNSESFWANDSKVSDPMFLIKGPSYFSSNYIACEYENKTSHWNDGNNICIGEKPLNDSCFNTRSHLCFNKDFLIEIGKALEEVKE